MLTKEQRLGKMQAIVLVLAITALSPFASAETLSALSLEHYSLVGSSEPTATVVVQYNYRMLSALLKTSGVIELHLVYTSPAMDSPVQLTTSLDPRLSSAIAGDVKIPLSSPYGEITVEIAVRNGTTSHPFGSILLVAALDGTEIQFPSHRELLAAQASRTRARLQGRARDPRMDEPDDAPGESKVARGLDQPCEDEAFCLTLNLEVLR